MKKINQVSAKVFCKLLDRLQDKSEITLNAAGCMPLTLAKLEENILTPAGVAVLYSLAHYYRSGNKRLRHPEMRFLVINSQAGEADTNKIAIYPQYFVQDTTNDETESITLRNGMMVAIKKTYQAEQVNYASQWLLNIQRQGFLK